MYKSRLIYLALIIVSFIFSQSLYEPIAFMTFVIILLLPLVSIMLALISYPFIKLKAFTSKLSLCRFDKFILKILVRNYSPFICPALKISCLVPDIRGTGIEHVIFAVNASVANGGFFSYTKAFSIRGIYNIGVESVEYYDFLKLIKIKKSVNNFVNIRVNPRYISLSLPVSSQQQQQENSTFVGTAMTIFGGDMVGVREYSSGDSLKNVHWKLTAKGENVIMKTFAEDIYDQAFVVADMSAYYENDIKSRSMTDCVIEAALSAIRDYAANSVRFSLIINIGKNDNIIYPISSPAELHEAQSALSSVKMIKNTSIIDLLRCTDRTMISGAEVCIISSFASDETLKNIKKIFIDSKNKINIIRISEAEIPEKDGVLTYSCNFIERFGRYKANESN